MWPTLLTNASSGAGPTAPDDQRDTEQDQHRRHSERPTVKANSVDDRIALHDVGIERWTWLGAKEASEVVRQAFVAPSQTRSAEGDHAVARWMRSGTATAQVADARPALPGPECPMRLSDAFGLGPKPSPSTSTEVPTAPAVQR